jgi:hypothetical protein
MKLISLVLWSPLMTDDFKAHWEGKTEVSGGFVGSKSNQY